MGRPRRQTQDDGPESEGEVVLLPLGSPRVRWCDGCKTIRDDDEWACAVCGQRTSLKPKVRLDG